MRTGGPSLSLRRAAVLGLIQGPCELLPISSSGHLTLVPWLLRGRAAARADDPEVRKALEVSLHAGTAVALLFEQRGEVAQALAELTTGRAGLIALSFLPAAVAGLALERPIERRLGTPATIAGGLLAGSVAMILADRREEARSHEEAGMGDAVLLGLAQACALVPGVSRNGATLAAARARRFRRPDAERLSRHVALPVIVGATALKLIRLRNRRTAPETAAALLVGAVAAAASTLTAARLWGRDEGQRPLLGFAVYRIVLAAVVVVTDRRRAGDTM